MKSRQLTNVLIKILGLSVCLHAIPTCVIGIFTALTMPGAAKTDITAIRIIGPAVAAGVQAVFGIIVIVASETIAGWMFKKDDE